MSQLDDENRSLYRFEYYEPEDNYTYVDWAWLAVDEIADYKSGLNNVKVRPATEDEADLYNEAYTDGYGVATLTEIKSKYDGVTFRVELDEKGELNMQGKKMFQCAVCDRHLDFDTEVATIEELYLGSVKDDKLWHVCHGCALLQIEISQIEITPEDGGVPG